MLFDECDRVASQTFAPADEACALACRCFHVDAIDGDAEIRGDIRSHRLAVFAESRCFRENGCVDVDDDERTLRQQFANVPQKSAAIGTTPLWIRIGKVLTDVAKCCSTEQRIAHRV